MESGSASPLGRKDRGSHPVPGSGLKQRGQRENVGTGFKPVLVQFRSRIKTFVNNHLLDPDFFLGGRRMNFHKTIGFLASLLLVLGLGVPDSYAQEVTNVTLTLNGGSALELAEDAGAAVVTVAVVVTYDADRAADDTESITLSVHSDDTALGTFAPTLATAGLSATVKAGNLREATGQVILAYSLPTPDDNAISESFRVVPAATTTANASDVEIVDAALTIADDDVGVDGVTVTLNGMEDLQLAEDAGAAVVTVAVVVDFDGNKEADDEQEVTLAFTDITGDTFEPTPPPAITVTVKAGDLDQATGEVVLAYSLPPADVNFANESITVTATVAADATVSGEAETDEATLTIVDDDVGVDGVTVTLNGTDDLRLAEKCWCRCCDSISGC